jgi:hypothetical protein
MHLSNFHNFAYIILLGITEKIIAFIFLLYSENTIFFILIFFHALNNSLPFLIIIAYKLTT